ncbi:MAG: hypothetical protein MR598_07455 [Erysipelotrichaceae bacterium]|nr:hypothetical protein [Erysipelotrichaceae bacterium]
MDEKVKAGYEALNLINELGDNIWIASPDEFVTERYQTLISNMVGGWIGPDADNYISQLNTLSAKVSGTFKWIEQFCLYMKEHIQELIDEAQKQASKADELSTNL